MDDFGNDLIVAVKALPGDRFPALAAFMRFMMDGAALIH